MVKDTRVEFMMGIMIGAVAMLLLMVVVTINATWEQTYGQQKNISSEFVPTCLETEMVPTDEIFFTEYFEADYVNFSHFDVEKNVIKVTIGLEEITVVCDVPRISGGKFFLDCRRMVEKCVPGREVLAR